jgi:hypothetical protein
MTRKAPLSRVDEVVHGGPDKPKLKRAHGVASGHEAGTEFWNVTGVICYGITGQGISRLRDMEGRARWIID